MLHSLEDLMNSSNGFNSDVATQFSQMFPLTKDIFKVSLSVICRDQGSHGRPFSKNMDVMKKLDDFYKKMVTDGVFPQKRLDGQNLSHIFKYNITELQTAYKNNVSIYFPKYVKRYVKARIRADFMQEESIESWYDVSKQQSETFNTRFKQVIKYLFVKHDEEPTEEIILRYVQEIRSMLPRQKECWAYDCTVNPAKFLPYMLYINRLLEELGVKQYSPNPFRSQFVPKSIHMDTAALIDMFLSDKKMFSSLKVHLTGEGWLVPEKLTKIQLYDKIKFSHDSRDFRNETEKSACFKTDVWSFFVRDKVLDKYRTLVFNNFITTNGFQASVHYVDSETYARGNFVKGINVVSAPPADEFEYVQRLDEVIRKDLLDNDNYILLAADPGKANLLTLSEASQKENVVLKYTRGRRYEECSFNKNKNSREVMMNLEWNVEAADLQKTIVASGKSSISETFTNYLRQVSAVVSPVEELYKHIFWRKCRYRSKLGVRSSEDKLKHRIRRTFDPHCTGKKIVIMYGNWGKNPSLKHQPPSPGIGLRKRLCDNNIETYTVDERGTSSICPSCDGELNYPLEAQKGDQDDLTGESPKKMKTVHHVLRCKNESCRIWWNRDVLGVRNIKRQAMFCLEHGVTDGKFLNTIRPTKICTKRGEPSNVP